MHALDKYEMQYLESMGGMVSWRNPKTKKWEEYPFTPEQKARLDSFTIIEESHFLEMDNHGLNIHLFVYKETEDGPLLGFLFARGSEESFYGEDYFAKKDVGPFEVKQFEVTQYDYRKTDDSQWMS